MRPRVLLAGSIVLNMMLVILVIWLAAGVVVQEDVPQSIRYSDVPGVYPERMDVREYRDAVDHGLLMRYTEFLEWRYPDHEGDVFGGPYYYLRLHELPLDPDFPAGSMRVVTVTDADLEKYPQLGNLFASHVPFSLIRVNRSELDLLQPFVAEDVLLYRNGVFYGHPTIAEVVLGGLILFTVGFGMFAYTKRRVSEDPSSRAMVLLRCIENGSGCTMQELIDLTGFSRGSISYNLHRLEEEKRIRRSVYHGLIRYFPCKNSITNEEAILHEVLGKQRSHAIFSVVFEMPGLSRKEIGAQTSIPVSTLQWYLTRLGLDGVLVVQKEKNSTQYFVGEIFSAIYAETEEKKRDDR